MFLRENVKKGTYYKSLSDSFYFNLEVMLKCKYWLNGIAAKQYLDYVSLKESRKNAKQATFFALFSIFVAVFAMIISSFQSSRTPKPPYDVKIIANDTKTIQLENKLQKLHSDYQKEKQKVVELQEKFSLIQQSKSKSKKEK